MTASERAAGSGLLSISRGRRREPRRQTWPLHPRPMGDIVPCACSDAIVSVKTLRQVAGKTGVAPWRRFRVLEYVDDALWLVGHDHRIGQLFCHGRLTEDSGGGSARRLALLKLRHSCLCCL
jgi:hypothetical protein